MKCGPGGTILLIGFVLIALFDGVLGLILLAAGGAYLTYAVVVLTHQQITAKIYRTKEREIEIQVASVKDKDTRRLMERQARQELSELQDQSCKDDKGVENAGGLMALGVLVFPVLLIGVLIGGAWTLITRDQR